MFMNGVNGVKGSHSWGICIDRVLIQSVSSVTPAVRLCFGETTGFLCKT